jgi:protein-tyrosine phosphatase
VPPYPTLQTVIDLHSHILPGLDDGARTIADSRALAKRSEEDGVTAIAATPHVRADYPTTAEEMERGVEELRADFRANDIAVQVLHGGEIDLEVLLNIEREELVRFTLAQTGRYLLVETPYMGWPPGLERVLFDLDDAGLVPVLAHPERNHEVQARPERLANLVTSGTLIQVTAASLDGRLGRSTKDAAQQLLELEFVHLLASDAHTPDIREAGLLAAAGAVRDDNLARYLTEEAPAAIVAGEPLPERPPRKRRRRRFVLF